MNIEERMRKAYQERVGKVYGIWEVVNVEYDESSYNKQLWTIRCTKCGKIKKVKYGKELIKGRTGNFCECMSKSNQPKAKALSYGEKVNKHIGEIYRNWKVIGWQDGKGLEVECIHCGRRLFKPAKQVLNCSAPHCVCEFSAKYDESYIGKRYGRLVVQSLLHKNINGQNRIVFDCLCDCGKSRLARPVYLERGDIVCCGNECIYKNEKSKLLEGNSKEMLYKKWQNMKNRCYNPKNSSYEIYGGRGIKVCDEWKNDYVAFRKWALEFGYKEGLSIDRIDPDGDYAPYNCRFITLNENSGLARHGRYTLQSQGQEVRKSKYSDIRIDIGFGNFTDVHTACEMFDVCVSTLYYRVNKMGMSWQEAFDKSKNSKKRKAGVYQEKVAND